LLNEPALRHLNSLLH